ncbi:hypothetical protein Cantr_09359 [Candida viswanathii]|uniref:Uncharacterized protein n=1 Tax=Candida viswanathii TaxID=5486 RepID=A0A367YAR9_9ASCO|nr:hypothetical protein Cantr_09359 [Candida viswanathii]
MPSEQPLDLRGLSAPEELTLPLESHRDLRVTAFSELPQARVGGICVFVDQIFGSMTSTEVKKSPTHLGRGQERSRLSAPEELTSPLLMDYHLSDAASSELPRVPIAPEELTLPLESHRDLRVTAFSELPQARVGGICVPKFVDQIFGSMTSTEMKKSPTHLGREQEWARLSAPEELTSPLLMDHHIPDGASSELPRVPMWDLYGVFRITSSSSVSALCGELQPNHKEPIQGRREFEPSRLSAPEEPAPPFWVHHEPSDGDSSELPRVARPRRANFTAVDGLPPSRRQIFRITTIPGRRPLCGELQPGHKSTMPSERPVDVRGLSAPEELRLPSESHRHL